jgi:uncharacterized protein YbgA (DUF1722 family)
MDKVGEIMPQISEMVNRYETGDHPHLVEINLIAAYYARYNTNIVVLYSEAAVELESILLIVGRSLCHPNDR